MVVVAKATDNYGCAIECSGAMQISCGQLLLKNGELKGKSGMEGIAADKKRMNRLGSAKESGREGGTKVAVASWQPG